MKTPTAKTKLTTLTILTSLAYCLLIMSSFTNGWDDFKLGFEEGYSLKVQTYFVDLKAKESISTFPDSIKNLKTGTNINIRYYKARIRAAVISVTEKSIEIYQMLEIIISLIVMSIIICIPILFFKLMKSLIHEVVFDKTNIRYMRLIAVLLLVYYLIDLITNQVSYQMNVALFNFSEYTIQREPTNMIWFLLGCVLFLFAEILSKGSIIQEEQDLTI